VVVVAVGVLLLLEAVVQDVMLKVAVEGVPHVLGVEEAGWELLLFSEAEVEVLMGYLAQGVEVGRGRDLEAAVVLQKARGCQRKVEARQI
jgi:hypothetical protein